MQFVELPIDKLSRELQLVSQTIAKYSRTLVDGGLADNCITTNAINVVLCVGSVEIKIMYKLKYKRLVYCRYTKSEV